MPSTLTDRIRLHLDDPDASSFQLMGEDLLLISGADLCEAADAYRAELGKLPTELRAEVSEEQRRLLRSANRWLRTYNKNIVLRIQGYMRLARLCHFEYPWPIVAVLGVCTVLDGLQRMRAYGIVGGLARKLTLPQLEGITERIDDILRRTNRGIFADSVPTVLYALRCHELRAQGKAELAEALVHGPLPPTFDEESRQRLLDLYHGLAEPDGAQRFARLSAVTLVHFGREQAIFTHQLGERLRGPLAPHASWIDALVSNPKSVRAPRVKKGQLVYEEYKLPRGFDFRDHVRRVEVFGDAFVKSVTRRLPDYQAGITYLAKRFLNGEPCEARYPKGPAQSPDATFWDPSST